MSADTSERVPCASEGKRAREVPSPVFADDLVTLYSGDCIDVLPHLPDASIDAVVTDPPYGLGFMGKEWDSFGDTRQPGDANFTPGTGPFGRAKVRHGMSSSYATPGMSAPGIGERTIAWPSHLGGLNPRCQRCERWQRGANPCTCDQPDFPNDRAARTAAFGEWCATWAAEAFRVLKPGGHMLAFGGSRTWHRLAAAIEDVGFELRDSIAWLYGSGFPKSLDVSKAIDKVAGAEREKVPTGAPVKRMTPGADQSRCGWWIKDNGRTYQPGREIPATAEAAAWEGWGTALKPAFEPIVVARKPLRGSVARNVLDHGTGALHIDACRIPAGQDYLDKWASVDGIDTPRNASVYGEYAPLRDDRSSSLGRWPTNVVLDEHQASELDGTTGWTRSRIGKPRGAAPGDGWGMTATGAEYDDEGGPSRFFPVFRYEAKASTSERPRVDDVAHPTVKPLDLMRWLVRLVAPPRAVVLDPFAGSGTTAEACVIEGVRCITIERDSAYLPLIVSRLAKPVQHDLFSTADTSPAAANVPSTNPSDA